MRASSLSNGGGTLVADQLNGVQSQFDKLRFSQNNQGNQQQPIGQKTAASIVAASLGKGVPSSPIYAPGSNSPFRNGLYQPGQFGSSGSSVINENDFPILGARQSPSNFGGHIPTTSFGNATPTVAAVTAGLASIPSYGSKDASGSMAGLQRMPYG